MAETRQGAQKALNDIADMLDRVSIRLRCGISWYVPNHGVMDEAIVRIFQHLSSDQESNLCGWVITNACIGLRPTYFEVLSVAAKIARQNGDRAAPGSNWYHRFLLEHPEIPMACETLRPVDSTGAEGGDGGVPTRYAVPPSWPSSQQGNGGPTRHAVPPSWPSSKQGNGWWNYWGPGQSR